MYKDAIHTCMNCGKMLIYNYHVTLRGRGNLKWTFDNVFQCCIKPKDIFITPLSLTLSQKSLMRMIIVNIEDIRSDPIFHSNLLFYHVHLAMQEGQATFV